LSSRGDDQTTAAELVRLVAGLGLRSAEAWGQRAAIESRGCLITEGTAGRGTLRTARGKCFLGFHVSRTGSIARVGGTTLVAFGKRSTPALATSGGGLARRPLPHQESDATTHSTELFGPFSLSTTIRGRCGHASATDRSPRLWWRRARAQELGRQLRKRGRQQPDLATGLGPPGRALRSPVAAMGQPCGRPA